MADDGAIHECLLADDPVRAVQLAALERDLLLLARAYLSLGAVGQAAATYRSIISSSSEAATELAELTSLCQTWLDHPARLRQLFYPPPPPSRSHSGAVVTFESRTSGVHIACSIFVPPSARPRALALYFHGNAEDAHDCEASLCARFHEHGLILVVVEPRGYGRSTRSEPQLTALLDDVEPLVTDEDALERIRAAAGPAAARLPLLIFGRSIGCHVAIHLCALAVALGDQTWAAGLVLDSGTASVRHWESIVAGDDGGASDGRPPVPGRLQTIGVLENRGKMQGLGAYSKLPLLVLHGGDDQLVPLFQARLLHECYPLSRGRAQLVVLEGRGHDDLHHAPQYDAAVGVFVDRVLAAD